MNIVHACKFLGPVHVSQIGWSREYGGEITYSQATTPEGEIFTAVEVQVFCNKLEDGPPMGERMSVKSHAYCVAIIRFDDFYERDGGWVFTAYNGDDLASFLS